MKWIAVPEKPTSLMVKCGASRGPYGDERYYLSEDEVREIWEMMISAVQDDSYDGDGERP